MGDVLRARPTTVTALARSATDAMDAAVRVARQSNAASTPLAAAGSAEAIRAASLTADRGHFRLLLPAPETAGRGTAQ